MNAAQWEGSFYFTKEHFTDFKVIAGLLLPSQYFHAVVNFTVLEAAEFFHRCKSPHVSTLYKDLKESENSFTHQMVEKHPVCRVKTAG